MKLELKVMKQFQKESQDTLIEERKYNKKRYDVIRNLNTKKIKPLKSSIEKYKLIFENEIWI